MKLVVAIEGVDGAGKSTLARAVYRQCQDYGRPFTAVGRRGSHASRLVTKVTRLLYEEAANLSAAADILIRLGREYQRALEAAAAPAGVVVLNRFLLSVLARVRANGQDVATVLPFFKEISASAGLWATVLVQCPCEIAFGRVRQRRRGSRPRTPEEEQRLRQLAGFVAEDFRQGLLTGEQWLIDNSGALGAAEEHLGRYLLPYLRGGS